MPGINMNYWIFKCFVGIAVTIDCMMGLKVKILIVVALISSYLFMIRFVFGSHMNFRDI